jgi:hypothetical protein
MSPQNRIGYLVIADGKNTYFQVPQRQVHLSDDRVSAIVSWTEKSARLLHGRCL